jgi:RNA-directed DNA polymerase
MKQNGYRMVRYANDFVVLCRTAGQAKAALEGVGSWVEQHGLSLNLDRTHVGDCREAGKVLSFSAIASRRGSAG